jgi:hypothetical protein
MNMPTDRRSFLKGLGLVTAGIVLMPEEPLRRLWALGAPLRLWGDGIHDDGPALQAILDGRWKEVADAVRYSRYDGTRLLLNRGHFRIDRTLVLQNHTEIIGVKLQGAVDPFLVAPKSPKDIHIWNSTFINTGPPATILKGNNNG